MDLALAAADLMVAPTVSAVTVTQSLPGLEVCLVISERIGDAITPLRWEYFDVFQTYEGFDRSVADSTPDFPPWTLARHQVLWAAGLILF